MMRAPGRRSSAARRPCGSVDVRSLSRHVRHGSCANGPESCRAVPRQEGCSDLQAGTV